MNDLLDLSADRQHPTKRHRALAAGRLPMSSALLAIPALWLLAVAASLCISPLFLGVLGGYLATTIAYSLVLKRKMLVDVVTLAGLYTLRIIAGAVGVGVVLSEWLLIFSLFVFTSLALIKRFSELSMRESAGLADPSNRDYRITDLHIIGAMAAASAMNAVTVFLALRLLLRGDAALQPSLDVMAAQSAAALLVRPRPDDGASPRDARRPDSLHFSRWCQPHDGGGDDLHHAGGDLTAPRRAQLPLARPAASGYIAGNPISL
ncbi:4-hydroxybenzoate polyprenyltransferase [Bradyrhizobium sp. i1.3.6]